VKFDEDGMGVGGLDGRGNVWFHYNIVYMYI